MTLPFRLRSAHRQDLGAMYALDVACFEPRFRFSRNLLAELAFAPGALALLAVRDAALLGMLVLNRAEEPGVWTLSTLDTDPAQRRQGIGRALLAEAERWATAQGGTRLVLEVFTGNAAAIALYERQGYSRQGLVAGYYGAGVDAWQYARAL